MAPIILMSGSGQVSTSDICVVDALSCFADCLMLRPDPILCAGVDCGRCEGEEMKQLVKEIWIPIAAIFFSIVLYNFVTELSP